jgi:exonuclease III
MIFKNQQSQSKLNFNNKNDKIILVHWNAHFITNKLKLFEHFLYEKQIDICIVTETNINENTAIDLSNLQLKYELLFKNRIRKKGGGVMVCINKNLNFFEIKLPNQFNEIEIVALKIIINKVEYIIVGIYNPPQAQLQKDLFIFLEQNYGNVIIMGDLNSKHLSIGCRKENTNGKVLEEILLDTNFIICNNHDITHKPFNTTEGDILDIAMCSSRIKTKVNNFEVLNEYDMSSDHYPIQISLEITAKQIKASDKIGKQPKYNFKRADWVLFRSVLDSKIAEIKLIDNLNLLNDKIVETLLQAADTSIPVVNHNIKFKVVLPKYVLDMIRKKST